MVERQPNRSALGVKGCPEFGGDGGCGEGGCPFVVWQSLRVLDDGGPVEPGVTVCGIDDHAMMDRSKQIGLAEEHDSRFDGAITVGRP